MAHAQVCRQTHFGLLNELVGRVYTIGRKERLTRLSNLDADVTALERDAILGKSGLQALNICELGICETLWSLLLAVLDDADADNVASLEELGHTLDSSIVRQVTKVGSIRRLGWQIRSADVVTDRVITWKLL